MTTDDETAVPTLPGDQIMYRPQQAAAACGVSVQTIFNWLRDGELQRIKEGKHCTLILRSELEERFQRRAREQREQQNKEHTK